MKILTKLRDYVQSFLILVLVITIMLVFTTADADLTPPNISNVGVMNETSSSAMVYWETDEGSTSRIDYGTASEEYAFTFNSTEYVTQHLLLIQDLEAETTYYFMVLSTDINGNENTSEEYQFVTLEDISGITWSNAVVIPESPAVYGAPQEFKVDWTSRSSIENVTINIDGQEFQTMQNGSVYVYNAVLKAGTHSWFMFANDSKGNENRTENFTYVVQKTIPIINLYLNSLEENIIVIENSTVNITGILSEGEKELELIIDGVVVPPNGSISSSQTKFTSEGIFSVVLRVNESENYSGIQIDRQIEVTPLELKVIPNKGAYSIGETAGFSLTFPEEVTINLEVCGPIPQGGSGFVECNSLDPVSGVSSPFAVVHSNTKKSGEYIINADTTYEGNLLESVAYYNVTNTLDISVLGDKTVLTGDEINLDADASGGISPYSFTWKLADGSAQTEETLELTYNAKGTYETNISIEDSQGNKLSELFDIIVNQKHLVQIAVRDKDSQDKIVGAIVKLDGQSEITDSDGLAKFDVKKNDYSVVINADDYKKLSTSVDVTDNQTFTFDLLKDDGSSSNLQGFDVVLNEPDNDVDITDDTVSFKAHIITEKEAECSLYLIEQGDSWSRQISEFTTSTAFDFEHEEPIEQNKEYLWRIECTVEGTTFQSGTRTFRTPSVTSFGTDDESVVDAGEIRRRFELGIDNIETLDLKSKQAAEALQFEVNLERALRDYDRTIRDINNLNFRKDLTDSERDAKNEEYRNNLRQFESTIPVDITVKDTEEFVIYPRREELLAVASLYSDSLTLSGTLNFDKYEDLQNEILIKTRVSHVTLEMISGELKDITLVDKIIDYPGNENKTFFLLESVPKEVAQSAKEITFVTKETEIITNDPLIKFENPERITYYVESLKDIEEVKGAITVAFSESLYAKGGNRFTGAVIFRDIDLASPVSLVVIMVLAILVYLVYAYDFHRKVWNLLFAASRKKKIEGMLKIIYDSKDALGKGEVRKANLIFKEVKLLYENFSYDLKKEIYSEAISLYQQINIKYFEELFAELERSKTNGNIDHNLLKRLNYTYNELGQESQKNLSNELKLAYNDLMASLKK